MEFQRIRVLKSCRLMMDSAHLSALNIPKPINFKL